MLSLQQKAHFQEHSYLVVRRLLSPEVMASAEQAVTEALHWPETPGAWMMCVRLLVSFTFPFIFMHPSNFHFIFSTLLNIYFIMKTNTGVIMILSIRP
jgi:hypothetical protein